MAPVCWLMGIPWSQAVTAGGLMGIKTILNELVAYLQLAALPAGALDPRSRLIMLYAMCGFANFGSLGIMIAGLSTMCPEKRDEVVSLGLEVDRLRHADDVPARRDRRGADAVIRRRCSVIANQKSLLITDPRPLMPDFSAAGTRRRWRGFRPA